MEFIRVNKGFRVYGLGSVQGLAFQVQDLGCRVWSLGVRGWGNAVYEFGFKV
jgi:hypothetical protein